MDRLVVVTTWESIRWKFPKSDDFQVMAGVQFLSGPNYPKSLVPEPKTSLKCSLGALVSGTKLSFSKKKITFFFFFLVLAKKSRFLEVEFLKPVVNTPPGFLLGNLIGIPRKRIHIRKSGQLLLYLTVNGARPIRACPKKWAFHTGKSPLLSRCICILDPEKFHNPPPKWWRL